MGGGGVATERILGWRGCRYFYVTVKLGSPAHEYSLILDTGSTLTYVPCSDCGSHCGSHTHSPYDGSRSSTYQVGSPSSCVSLRCTVGWPCSRPFSRWLLSPPHIAARRACQADFPHKELCPTLGHTLGVRQTLTRARGVGERRCRR